MAGYEILQLNFSYEALAMRQLSDAMKLVTKGKAEIIEAVDGKWVKTERFDYPYPFVIRMLYMVNFESNDVAFTKRRVFVRDLNTCQYCGLDEARMTIDHVLPISKGGTNTWDNCVTACMPCNRKKSDKYLHETGMRLRKKPYRPQFHEFQRANAELMRKRQRARFEKYMSA